MRKSLKALLVLPLLLMSLVAGANDAPPAAADPDLEKRVMALSEELRCLVCQNQTLADSHAELAVDLKNQVREQLASGKTEEQVVEYMVERYGDFVLYRPPVKGSTWLLWFGPFALLVGGVAALGWKLKQRGKAAARADDAGSVSDADLKRAAALLDADNQANRKDPA